MRRRAAGGLPPSPPQAAPLQRPLLCAENILLGRGGRHEGRATGRVLLDAPLPLQGPSGARRVPKTRAAAVNTKVSCRREEPREDLSRLFELKLWLRDGRTRSPEWSAVPPDPPWKQKDIVLLSSHLRECLERGTLTKTLQPANTGPELLGRMLEMHRAGELLSWLLGVHHPQPPNPHRPENCLEETYG